MLGHHGRELADQRHAQAAICSEPERHHVSRLAEHANHGVTSRSCEVAVTYAQVTVE